MHRPAIAPPSLTLEEIREKVESARKTIEAIDVSFSCDTVGDAGDASQKATWRVRTAGSALRLDHRYRFEQVAREFVQVDSWDGKLAMCYQQDSGILALLSEPQPEANIDAALFFDVALWVPPMPKAIRQPAFDLVKILASEYTHLRPETELIDGHSCYVVDHLPPIPEGGKCVAIPNAYQPMHIWLDPDRGFVPIRHESLSKDGKDVVVSCNVEQCQEFENGVWLPTHATRRSAAKYAQTEHDLTYVISVEVEADQPRLTIHPKFDAATFDLRQDVPPKTVIADMRDKPKV